MVQNGEPERSRATVDIGGGRGEGIGWGVSETCDGEIYVGTVRVITTASASLMTCLILRQ